MPKKPSTLFTMQEYPPLSNRFWHILIVLAVHRANRAGVRFELGVVGDDRQAGRTIPHELPAVLTLNSPLSRFLADPLVSTFPSESLSTSLVNRQFRARFDKGINGSRLASVVVRPCSTSRTAVTDAAGTASADGGNNRTALLNA